MKYIYSMMLLLFLLSTAEYSAQNRLHCDQCGKEIKGRYIEAEGKHFHPKHFICTKCNKIISGSFIGKDNRFYHPDCYKDIFMVKCAVCQKPLTNEYVIDIYGNKYHASHNDALYRCSNCSRIISKATTNGGKTYSDGRHICNICSSDAVFSNSQISSLLKRVITRLEDLGLTFNKKSISVQGVDQIELKKKSGETYNDNMHGFCQTTTETKYINKKIVNTRKMHVIYVLNGVPSLDIESVIAHELMHVWLTENTKNNHDADLREGSCNYISYLYLRSLKNTSAKQMIKMLENEDDKIYGRGFRKVRTEFEGKNIQLLLGFLKNYKKI